jgi:hypothetical protein
VVNLLILKAWTSLSLPTMAGARCSGCEPKQRREFFFHHNPLTIQD